jgi:hypothetical protein
MRKQPGSVSHSILDYRFWSFPKPKSEKKKMKCENLQFNLSVYLDDCLDEGERALIDRHLVECPLCRQKLTDFQALRSNLRGLRRSEMPDELLVSMRRRISQTIEIKQRKSVFSSLKKFDADWLQMRLMPYSVGTALSLFLGFGLLWTLLSAAYLPEKNIELTKYQPSSKSATVLLTDSTPENVSGGDFDLNAVDYSAARLSVSGDSPSLNPQGALVALTKSIVRGNMKDDEVVVVADVFGNGLAQIAEVVEPSSDRRAVRELEKALKNDPNYAPFVPASFDRRSDTVRVILKINRVDIQTHSKSN